MLDKILDIIMTILPFFGGRKKRQQMAQEVKEFSELVKEQYGFLMAQLEKVLKDYFDLSDRVKEMHAEIFFLERQVVGSDGIAVRQQGVYPTQKQYGRMRTINLIVVHCSATREDKSFTEHDLETCHRRRGFNGTGYHFYIRRNGDIKSTRPIGRIGAHARGFNKESIGICYEGGLDCRGVPKDTRTSWQKHSLRVLILTLLKDFPGCRICGHRDLSPDLNGNGEIEPEEWIKACPCFEASKEWNRE